MVTGTAFCLPESEQPEAETYLTPPVIIAALLQQAGYMPPPGRIVDPCACGWGGWSIGAMAAEFWRRDADLSDLHPRAPDVAQADATERDYHGAGVVFTNPAFKRADEIRARALAQGCHVLMLAPLMALFDAGRQRGMRLLITHDWRIGFSILPEHLEGLAGVRSRLDSVTGWGLGGDGRHHAWGLWTPDHTGARYEGVTLERTGEALRLASDWLTRVERSADYRREVEAVVPQLRLFGGG